MDWILVLVQNDSNVKKESYSYTGPFLKIVSFPLKSMTNKKEVFLTRVFVGFFRSRGETRVPRLSVTQVQQKTGDM